MLKLLLLATELPLVDILAQLKHLKVRLYTHFAVSVRTDTPKMTPKARFMGEAQQQIEECSWEIM